MGHVSDGLYCLFEELETELVQKQCKDDGDGESHDDIQKVKYQSVPECEKEIPVFKCIDEIFKAVIACKRHLKNALYDTVLLERDRYIRGRYVFENNEINDRNEKKQIELPVSLQINSSRLLRDHRGVLCGNGYFQFLLLVFGSMAHDNLPMHVKCIV